MQKPRFQIGLKAVFAVTKSSHSVVDGLCGYSTRRKVDPMAIRRRWFQFSLRGFLVVLTIGCLWLGWEVERAREQRKLAQAIRECGGGIWYDWQLDFSGFPDRIGPRIRFANELPRPAWLHRLVGFDLFHNVEMVMFSFHETREEDIIASTPHLKRLPGLKAVWVGYWVSEETKEKLRAALPNCQVNVLESR